MAAYESLTGHGRTQNQHRTDLWPAFLPGVLLGFCGYASAALERRGRMPGAE